MRRLFLDCDQVLADFDGYVERTFGHPPRRLHAMLGRKRFLAKLRSEEDLFLNLPLLPDALHLFQEVKHLQQTILTACPPGGWAEPQKLAWAAKRFPGTQMICCPAKDKCLQAWPGDVLGDDGPNYRPMWEAAGVIFILH